MKKKLVLIVAVVLALSMLLAGCNMFVVNAERDYDQVLASVEYKGMVGEIKKGEFGEYFAQNFQTYNYYYNMKAEEAGDLFVSNIAKQKMILALAVEKRANSNVDLTKFNAINVANVKKDDVTKGYDVYSAYLLSLLNPDEQKYVKEATNKMFEDSFKDIVAEYEEANKVQESDDDKEEIKLPKNARPSKPKKEEKEFVADSKVTQADVDAIKAFFDNKKPDDQLSKEEIDAYKDLNKSLEKQYKTYSYYLAKQAESRLMTEYSEQYKFSGTIEDKYSITVNSQKQIYKEASKFKSDFEAGSEILIYNNGQYAKVKSILLKFSDDQTKMLDLFKKKYSEDSYIKLSDLREMLVFGSYLGGSEEIPVEIKESLLGLKVYKSNPDYDANKDIVEPKEDAYEDDKQTGNYPYLVNKDYVKADGEEEFARYQFEFLDVVAEIGQAIIKAGEDAKTEYAEKYPNSNDEIGKLMFINQKKNEVFADLLYSFNDDDGMFQGKDYIETPFGNKSDYVAEYAGLVRQLVLDNGTAGSVMVDASEGVAFGSYNLYKTTAKVGDDDITIYTDKENKISFIVNDFGVHIVMLTGVAIDEGYNGKIDSSEAKYTRFENAEFDMTPFSQYSDAEKEIVKKQNSFFVLNKNAYVSFDKKTGKALTVEEALNNKFKEKADTYVYSTYEKSLFEMYGEKLFDKADDVVVEGFEEFRFDTKLNKSIYNKIVNQFKKLEKKA